MNRNHLHGSTTLHVLEAVWIMISNMKQCLIHKTATIVSKIPSESVKNIHQQLERKKVQCREMKSNHKAISPTNYNLPNSDKLPKSFLEVSANTAMSSDNHLGIELTKAIDGTGKNDTFETAPTSQPSKKAETLRQEVEQQIEKNLKAKLYDSCSKKLTPEFWRKEVKRLVEAAFIYKSERIEALKYSVLAVQQNIAKIEGAKAPSKYISTQTELSSVQDVGTQTGNEGLSETLRQGEKRQQAESCETTSTQSLNENIHDFWRNEVKMQIIAMFTEHNQIVESLNAQILLLDHDLNKQTGEKGPSVSIFTQTELKNVKNFGTQTGTGEKLDVLYEIRDQLSEGCNNNN